MPDYARLNALAERGRRLAAAAMQPRTSGHWYRMEAGSEATSVYIYDEIGFFGVTASQFVQDLKAVQGNVDLHINSPGGSVFDGIAIYSALRNHPGTVTSYVDSLAASAASFVAMAGDRIKMEKPAKMMIHDANGLVLGNAADMREMADLLDEMSDTIAGIYADRAGGDVAGWRDAMRAESWYSASQAVEAGLADEVIGASKAESAPQDRRSQLIRARARVTLKG